MIAGPGKVRAGILVIGSEISEGKVLDRNGGWIAARLTDAGLEVSTMVTVRDRHADLSRALLGLRAEGVDLIVTAGGLGSTQDDITAEVVAEFTGRPLTEHPALLEYLAAQPPPESEPARQAWLTAGTKQAWIPSGAEVVTPAAHGGTAPAFVTPPRRSRRIPPVVCLPGPPEEVRELFAHVLQTATIRDITRRLVAPAQRILRMVTATYADETFLGETVRQARDELTIPDLEISTCFAAGGAELTLVTTIPPGAQRQYDQFEDFVLLRHGPFVFSLDGLTVGEIVRMLLGDRAVGVIDAATGGLIGARLSRALGSAAVCSLSVDAARASGGTISTDVADGFGFGTRDSWTLAQSARAAFGTDIGIGLFPRESDPGTVRLAVVGRESAAGIQRITEFSEERRAVSERTVAEVLHALRHLLQHELNH
jgi:nicotinamide-nucleotide amidase